MSRIAESHLSEFGSEPTVETGAPTVATLLGAVGEYNDGVCLRLVTPPSVHVALRRREDTVVRFAAPDLKERKRASLSTIRGRKEDRWARLPKAVVQLLGAEGLVTSGADITLQSDAPAECGLSLTSAFTVALIDALGRAFSFDLDSEDFFGLLQRFGSHYLRLSQNEVRRLAESARMQKFAVPGRVYACDVRRRTLQLCDWQSTLGDEIVLLSAGVPQFTEDMSLLEIEELEAEALEALRERRPGLSLRDYELEDLEEVREGLSDAARRAALFVMGENRRVEESLELMVDGDINGLGELLSASHASLRENLDLSCPEIDWLVKRGLRVEPVAGMRIHGLAYGGAVLAILRNGGRAELLEAIDDYGRIFGFTPRLYTLVSDESAAARVSTEKLEM
ncbi:MAG: hypothetical protein ACLFP6_01985 [Spirochaetaceae bacterium]